MRIAWLWLAAVCCVDAQIIELGKKAYDSRCVGCHGLDGSGGGHGPGFLDVRRPRASTRDALRDVILKGIPDAGMPAFPMPREEADAISAYVEFLTAPAARNPVPGDAAAGERFFDANCRSCHSVRGRGGVTGPDLSNLAAERRLAQIEQALREPGSVPAGPPMRAATVRTRDGSTIRGVVKYDAPFDLGLMALDGRFHSIPKGSTAEITRERSVMPSLKTTSQEYRHLLAFLTRLNLGHGPFPRPETTSAGDVGSKPGEWPSYNGSPSGNRHSPLAQINRENVSGLAPRWMFPIPGGRRALQTTPVVVGGLMYVTAVNEAWALDARTGRALWHYSRPRTPGLVGDAASGINRGVAVWRDRVFLQTDNAHLIALDRMTGQLLFDVEIADHRQHYGGTGAPLVVEDLVIAGVSGGDEGARGLLDAYNASTGDRAWRFWTVPARGEPGSETWQGSALEHGCATTWLTGSYDPEARLLYWPTGNPCPDYNGDERKGDNLYSDSVLALDPSTGKLRWHYQFTPHDLHDWDATETLVLVDALFRGRPRKLLLQGNRNGFFYVLDRITGALLMAKPFVKKLTWASGIGPDGRPMLRPGYEPTPQGSLACPAVAGASNWPSTAFNPDTRLFYLMAEESCNIYTKRNEVWERGKSFYGGGTRPAPGERGRKFLRALELETGNIAWEIPVEGGILESGLMSTAGGLVFYGDGGGDFVAADAKTGKLLWRFYTGQSWKAGPMSYAVDGKQYVAISAGSTILAFAIP